MIYWLYYLACVFYCTARSLKKWKGDDIGASSMDMLMILTIGWLLAPIDFGIIWYKHYHNSSSRRTTFDLDMKDEHIY